MTPSQTPPWARRSTVVSALFLAGCVTLQLPIGKTTGSSPAPTGGITPAPSPMLSASGTPSGSVAPIGSGSPNATAGATPNATASSVPGAASPSPSPTPGASLQPTASPTPSPTSASALGTATVTTLAGSGTGGFIDGNKNGAYFNNPRGLAIGADGTLYVADTGNSAIRRVLPNGDVSVVANSTAHKGLKDSNPLDSWFAGASGIAASGSSLIVADTSNHLIRELRVTGTLTLAGSVSANGIGMKGELDGEQRTASFTYPSSVAVNASGLIVIGFPGIQNVSAASIRKIQGGLVTTVIKPSWQPAGLALDANGTVYACDPKTSAIWTIATHPSGGQEALLAGGSPGYADGTGSEARFLDPLALALGPGGDLFVCDSSNHRIRRVTPLGVVTTIAGDGTAGDRDGFGLTAQFNFPGAIAVNASGDLYVAEPTMHRIRKITFSR